MKRNTSIKQSGEIILEKQKTRRGKNAEKEESNNEVIAQLKTNKAVGNNNINNELK